MKERPLVSIIIPVYNGSNFMQEAIDSALEQTYDRIEIIVVNDGSTDDTERIALSYGNRIRYIHKENGGVSSALNLGIQEMKGDYFSWLSHDDKYYPNKIKNQIDLLNRHNAIGTRIIAYCQTEQIDASSIRISSYKFQRKIKSNVVIPSDIALNKLVQNNCFSGCALLIPKEAFKDGKLFNEQLKFCQDFELWMKLFASGYGLLCTNDVLVQSRVHDRQLTVTGKEVFHEDSISICKNILPLLAENSSKGNNVLRSFAVYNAKYNNKTCVQMIVGFGKENGLLNKMDLFSVLCFKLYGKIRPFIKKIYDLIR